MPESTGRAIELEEGSEAEIIESNEYIFDQIGSAVPISPSHSQFDPSTVPSQPLVVSEQHQLLFIAHTNGFLVAKTLDVIRFAKEIKERGTGPSLKELCVMDVCVGKVHILALSTDSKMLAACVGGDIHFYLVESLLNKEQTSHASCSLDAPEYVKDMRWKNKNEKSYIVLSNSGRLYHGVVGGSLEHVFDDVDAVEWSVNQSLGAMARKNVLSVLTHDFKETLSMSLCFGSWVDGADDDYSVKVDSIRWCRPDCIILGCLLVKADGTEENYLVQAISVKEGSFANTSTEPLVSSFSELFTGITDDIVPSGKGPHLFLCYLRQCELGIIANKKNVDQHINLITWLTGDLNSEIALIYFSRDKWAPRIPLQDDGDDNVVVGLSLDGVSMYEKVRFQKGVDDPKELSPYCIMFCLTLEGKLIMFHLASIFDNPTRHMGTMLPDEETTSEASDVRPDHDQLKLDPEIKQPTPMGSVSLVPEINDTNDSKMQTLNQLKLDPETKQPTLNGPVLRFPSQEISKNDQLQVERSEGLKRNDTSDSTMRIPDQLKVDPDTKHQQLKGSFLSFQSQGVRKNDMFQMERSEVPKRNDTSDSTMKIPYQLKVDPDTKQQQLKGSFLNFQSQGVSKNDPFQMERREVPKRNYTNDLKMRIPDQLKVDRETKQPTLKGPDLRFQSQEVSNIDRLQMQRSEAPIRNDATDSNIRIPDNGFRSESTNKGTKPLLLELPTDASLSKGSANIKEMTEQLDKLLKDLEGIGGFADSSTGQRNTAEALSQGLEALACKCKTWKVIVKEHQEEIQDLLNKTVQVLARKTYLESIVKLATDTQYWDLWDRQGLGFELEMKHRNIIKIHQDLTNQLIQLEMHFNNMELNKFGKKDRAYDNSKGLQNRLREPRHIQSLNSLQNTMNSQLVVAEQLSQSLSEQMDLLNVDSPCSKQQNVKRDLFKTIGLPLDDAASFNSPGYSSFEKRAAPLSSSVQILPKRNQTTGKKNPEPETARRRRESLGRSWVDFEPLKTTVRRSPLPEGRKPDIGKPSSIPCMLEESISSLQKERRTPSTLHPSHNKVVQEAVAVESKKTSQFKWVNNDTGLFKTEGTVSSVKASVMPFSFPSITSKPLFGHSSANSTGSLTSEKAVVEGSSGNGPNDTNLPLLADRTNSDTPKKSPTTSQLHVQLNRSTSPGNFSISSKGVSSEIPALGGNVSLLNAGSCQNHSSSQVYSFPASSSTTAATSLMKPKVNVASESRPSESVPPSISFTPSLGDYMPQGAQNRSSEEVKPQFSSFGASVSHTSGFSLKLKDAAVSEPKVQKEEKSNEQSSFGGIANVGVSVYPKSVFSSKLEAAAESEKNIQKERKLGEPTSFGGFANVGASASPTSGFSLKLNGAEVSEQIFREEVKLSEPSTFSGTVNAEPNSIPKSQLEQTLPTFNGIASTEKVEASSNADYQEDEMEEQAPEVSPVTELSLGNLGGFGLGSTPTQGSATPSRNPFGGSLDNSSASPVSSPLFKLSSGSEMFRPASFSFAPTPPQQQQAPSQPTTAVGGFSSSATPVGFGFAANQAPSGGGFGQPAQVGQGQQALGSALGSFGQSRQIGFGQPANNFAPTNAFGSGFGGNQSAGGFANVAPKSGGFASLASNSGGFAAAASATSGGFAGAAAPVGGNGFGGFAGASGSGAGFGAAGGTGFGQKGSSLSAFGGTGAQPPAQLFTQMRK